MLVKYLSPFFLLFISCKSPIYKGVADLQYQLSYSDEKLVHVKLIYTPLEKDSTKFTYGEPMFGGQTDIINGLCNLKVSSPLKIRFYKSTREIVVYYPDTSPVILEYDIKETRTPEQGLRGELFRPIIQTDYFYCHGINLFLNPAFRDTVIKAKQSVLWLKQPGFRLFQSFDPDNNGERISTGEVKSFMFELVTGANDLITEKIRVDGTDNYLVLRTNQNIEYNKKTIAEFFKKYYEGIRTFWNDSSKSPYCLIIQPFLTIDHNIGGMALGNGFAGKYTFKADSILTPDRMFVLSHEIGHHWIGGKIETDIKDQWFGEGFNDYLTFYTLMMTRLMTPRQFEDRFNTILKSHYISSINNMPNDSVWKYYWKMGDYNKLPYRRGAIFAFYLDNQIRIASNEEKNLHDMMLSLSEYTKSKGKNYQITVDDFTEVTSVFLQKEKIISAVNKYIIKGEPISFSNDMLVNGCEINYIDSIPVLNITDEERFASMFSVKNTKKK